MRCELQKAENKTDNEKSYYRELLEKRERARRETPRIPAAVGSILDVKSEPEEGDCKRRARFARL